MEEVDEYAEVVGYRDVARSRGSIARHHRRLPGGGRPRVVVGRLVCWGCSCRRFRQAVGGATKAGSDWIARVMGSHHSSTGSVIPKRAWLGAAGGELARISELLTRMHDVRPRRLHLEGQPLRGGLEATSIARGWQGTLRNRKRPTAERKNRRRPSPRTLPPSPQGVSPRIALCSP